MSRTFKDRTYNGTDRKARKLGYENAGDYTDFLEKTRTSWDKIHSMEGLRGDHRCENRCEWCDENKTHSTSQRKASCKDAINDYKNEHE